MIAVITSPTLLLLIIQTTAFPLTWQSSTITNEVKASSLCVILEYLTVQNVKQSLSSKLNNAGVCGFFIPLSQ